MFKPGFEIAIGNISFNSSQNPGSQINTIEVQLGLSPLVDFVKIMIGTINKPEGGLTGQAMTAGAGVLNSGGSNNASTDINGSPITIGDDITIELGFDDNLTQVFTGTLSNIELDISNAILAGSNGAESLIKTRINQSYQNQEAGQIISDLANQAGIETDVIESGINFPYYVIDDRKHTFQHAIELAEKSGLDLYFSPKNKIVLKKFNKSSPDHTFIYGENIIELQIQNSTPLTEQVLVSIESPASSQGNDTWHWFAKNSSSFLGLAGTGNGVLIQEPGIRTKEAADTYAQGKLGMLKRTATRGKIKIMGNPEVTLGDAIAIEGVPNESLNGLFQVRRIKHFLSSEHGFTTTIDFITAHGGNGLGA